MTGNAYHDAHCVKLFGVDKGSKRQAERESSDSMTTTISSILIEALARRAQTVAERYRNGPNTRPSVADFQTAFVDELKRFQSPMESSTSAFDRAFRGEAFEQKAQSQPQRARLVPDSDRPSLGNGIGQQTGGTAQSDADEAKRILSMIENVHGEVIESVCGGKAAQFISEMQVRRRNGGPLCVTGKQLFWLRDLSQQLVEKGYV